MNRLLKSLVTALTALFASSAMAIPALQIGDEDGGVCNAYDLTHEDCLVGEVFSLTSFETGNAYLVVSTVPQDSSDNFDVAPSSDDNGALLLMWSGYDTPPVSDSNSLAPHGIFETYSEVYRVHFGAADAGDVYNTQPGEGDGSKPGYIEYITLNLTSLVPGTGIHFDLFTCDGAFADCQVRDFAPFSHDATYVPVPAAVWLFGTGLLGLVGIARRRKST